MSRQNDWKVKQFNKGNCIWCGKPREVPGFKRTCRACGKKHRARLRVKRGSSAWRKPGDMGRPPLWAAVSKTCTGDEPRKLTAFNGTRYVQTTVSDEQ